MIDPRTFCGFIFPGVVRSWEERMRQEARLKMIRPDAVIPPGTDDDTLREAIDCALADSPLPWEDGYHLLWRVLQQTGLL